MHSFYLPLAALIALLHSSTIAFGGLVDTKKYSYVCLESDQDLCMGVSPGDGEPFFDPSSILWLQVKPRERNENAATDYKKTRWDLSYGQSKVALSRFSDLCVVKESRTERVGLYPCNSTFPATYSNNINFGRWDLNALRRNVNGAGMMQLAGNSRLCLTPMRCDAPEGETFCKPDSALPAWDVVANAPSDLRRGSYLRLKPCWNALGGVAGMKAIQVWRQRLDCAVGCPPDLEENDVCDTVCDTASCAKDKGNCITKSPTPPTKAPTSAAPAPRPTTAAPQPPSTSPPTITNPPTTSVPTSSPTVTCPQNGEIEYCNRWKGSQKNCLNNVRAKRLCTWCLNGCRPKADARVCLVSGLYDHCKATCPSVAAKTKCERQRTKGRCINKGRNDCSFCGPRSCRAGRDNRVCTDPNFFAHCALPSPGISCPAVTTVNRCHNRDSSEVKCRGGVGCLWCGGASARKCRPVSRVANYCSMGSDYLALAFPTCTFSG